jgi:hypothetical protein
MGMRQRAETNLFKIRAGRNIAGLLRIDQQPATDGLVSIQPTFYRYSTVFQRAKDLVNMAQQLETSYLAALEKQDTAMYSEMRANQDLESANAAVKVETLKVSEAQDSATLASDQQKRASIQVNHYNDLINSDISGLEQASIDFMWGQAGLETASAAVDIFGAGNLLGALFSGGEANISSIAQGLSALGAASGATASALSATANLEEKQKDWQFQLDVANEDVTIGQQQVAVANANTAIASQDLQNASLQANHAQATLDYLTTQRFPNAELYRWMRGVLGGVYGYLLRQATAAARLAENQLAFERQEAPLSVVIRADYWQPPAATAGNSSGNAQSPDRKGLTGVESLLQDLTQLDQYAFDTDRRKLQLTRTISLAQLDPFAFQRFIETGVLRFATPMDLFDHDFPGYYLRLIKRVRVSVVALIPPTRGICATLANHGISRVVVPGALSGFETTIVRRDPQLIALTSPANSTGLFDLTDTQSGMLLPFEGLAGCGKNRLTERFVGLQCEMLA